ncbi:MAG: hypothetical protein ACQEXX_01075 [Bacillota bacterium]
MGKIIVSARLRPKKDDDLRKALDNLPPYYDESDVVREALRQFLFSHKGRKPLIMGSQVFDESSITDEEDSIVVEQVVNESDNDLDNNLDSFIAE